MDYSSLVGIAVTGVAQTGNSLFTMDCAYYDLTCEDPIEVPPDDEVNWQSQPGLSPGVGSIPLPNGSSPFDSSFSMGTFTPYRNRFTDLVTGPGKDLSDDDSSPRTINIQSVTGSMYSWSISTTNCSIKTSTVQVAVKRLAQNYTVWAIKRLKRVPEFLENYTPFKNPEFAYSSLHTLHMRLKRSLLHRRFGVRHCQRTMSLPGSIRLLLQTEAS